jgi:peroxiredoxin Q/BCP
VTVSIGSTVPAFSAAATCGTFDSSTHAGTVLVLYFYPKDNTPGCTTESAGFRDAHAQFVKARAMVAGVSRDSLKSHESFKSKLELPFELISDPDEALCELFGVMKMKNMYGKQVRGIERSTFVIGADGSLLREWRGVKVPNHVQEVLAFIESL